MLSIGYLFVLRSNGVGVPRSTFSEALGHLSAVCVNLFGRRCWAVFGEKASSGFESVDRRLLFYGGREFTLQNALHIISWRKIMSVGLGFEGRFKFAGQLNG